MRKGVTGQVFIYAAGLIIAVAFFAYGISLIMSLGTAYEDISFEQLKSDLLTDMDFVAKNYGSAKVTSLNLPADYSVIVFADYSSGCAYSIPEIKNECSLYPAGDYNNIFLCDDSDCNTIEPLGQYKKIALSQSKVMITATGVLKINLENVPGGFVNITQVS